MNEKKKPVPLHGRIIIIPDAAEKETKGGIIVPDTAQIESSAGTVYAVGPATGKFTPLVKEGDRVLYNKFSGTEIVFDDEDTTEYLIMQEEAVNCIL